MEFRGDYRYALLAPTSMGLRLTPEGRQPVHCADRFQLQVTSAESNVASVPAALGLPVKLLTAFVEGSPLSARIKADLRARGVDYEGRDYPQEGPWGHRHQFNIADSGYGARGPRVHNDRSGEVGLAIRGSDFDLERIFAREGVAVMHLSGLFAALSPEIGRFCVELAEKAARCGTKISFDLNHRASFWKGREAELREIFSAIAAKADILVGNEEDFQLALGIPGPEERERGDLAAQIESYQGMIARVGERYPNAELCATTLRQVESAGRHLWGAMLRSPAGWEVIQPRPIEVLDRIGGGDGFVGGLLHGLLRGWEPVRCLRFGWATGALVTTLFTDYAQPADEEQIWSIWEGNARVQR